MASRRPHSLPNQRKSDDQQIASDPVRALRLVGSYTVSLRALRPGRMRAVPDAAGLRDRQLSALRRNPPRHAGTHDPRRGGGTQDSALLTVIPLLADAGRGLPSCHYRVVMRLHSCPFPLNGVCDAEHLPSLLTLRVQRSHAASLSRLWNSVVFQMPHRQGL